MLAVHPELVQSEAAADFTPSTVAIARQSGRLLGEGAAFGWMSQDLHASGAMGDARAATAEKGKALLDFGARAFVALLEEVERYDLQGLARGPLGEGRGQFEGDGDGYGSRGKV
jgi:creatinine amidohydrolase